MAKWTGAGALVEVNQSGDDVTWVPIGCTQDLTPPPESKATIDLTCQTDTVADTRPGIEEASEFTFTEFWDPVNGTDPVDDLYSSGNQVKWRVTFADAGSTAQGEFEGRVRAKEPSTVSGNDPVLRAVTVLRNGAITWS